jgi:hypothetical protein
MTRPTGAFVTRAFARGLDHPKRSLSDARIEITNACEFELRISDPSPRRRAEIIERFRLIRSRLERVESRSGD